MSLPETGPAELAELARLRLATEMLPGDADPALMAGLQRDLEAMDALLGQYLELAGGMVDETIETLGLRELVDAVVQNARRADTEIRWSPGSAPVPWAVQARALEHILANLFDNARRYAAGSKVEVECVCEGDDVLIGDGTVARVRVPCTALSASCDPRPAMRSTWRHATADRAKPQQK